MKIEFEELGENVVFKLSEYEKKYEKVFDMCFYEKCGDYYTKKFSRHIGNIGQIKAYYSDNAAIMFDQLGYFSPVPWEKALYEFAERIDGKGIDWWLTGSCASCIRGMDLNPHDVDIMVDSKCLGKIEEIFSDCIIEPIVDTQGWLTKDFGVLFLYARIDIASAPVDALDIPFPVDCGPYAREHLEEIIWNGFKIKVPPVDLQLYVNRKRNRHERVEKIKCFIKGNK